MLGVPAEVTTLLSEATGVLVAVQISVPENGRFRFGVEDFDDEVNNDSRLLTEGCISLLLFRVRSSLSEVKEEEEEEGG
jgi:hypothetical protein